MGLTDIAPSTLTGPAPSPRTTWQEEVHRLAAERDAVVLAHNYMTPEIQDVAHHVGDSLALSRIAAETDASTIVFCGVHFMAETAKILSPDKTVLVPTVEAGCSLADSIDAEQLRAWKAEHPDAVVVVLRQHHRRGEGGDRHLLHLLQRRRGRVVDPGRHRGALPARPVPRRARAPRDRARQPARLARRVPRPRRHPALRRPRPGRRPPRGRAAGAPRVRLRLLRPVAGRRGHPARRTHADPLDRRHGRGRGRHDRAAPRWSPPRSACCTSCAGSTPRRRSCR